VLTVFGYVMPVDMSVTVPIMETWLSWEMKNQASRRRHYRPRSRSALDHFSAQTAGAGYGRFDGKAGIDSFTELRWITIETGPGHYPI
jgi:hypothetical protein